MDERVYRIVMSRPIPDKLIRNLGRSAMPDPYRFSRYVNGSLTPNLLETLPLVCRGYTNKEIAAIRNYSQEAVKDHVKRLLAIYRARTRAHLAALAVARGDVEMNDGE